MLAMCVVALVEWQRAVKKEMPGAGECHCGDAPLAFQIFV